MFDQTKGIPAPLQEWHNILNGRNSAIANTRSKYFVASGISYPYGRKAFYLNTSGEPFNSFVLRPLSGYGGYGSVTLGAFARWNTYAFETPTVADWEQSVQTVLDPVRSPVCRVYVAKVKDAFAGKTNYSELKRALVCFPNDRNIPTAAMVSGVTATYNLQDNIINIADVKPISDIEDKYIVYGMDTYATDASRQLPRNRADYIPVVIASAATVTGIAGNINNKQTVTPIGTESIFPFFPGSFYEILGQYAVYTGDNSGPAWTGDDDNQYNNFGALMAGFDVGVTLMSDALSTYISGKAYEFKTRYNASMIVPHNYADGADITTQVKTANPFYKLPTPDPTPIKGVFATYLGRASFVFDSLDDIRAMFTDAGLVCGFDETEVQYFPVEDLGGGIASGYDTNDSPVVDSFPDNNTDDYIIDTASNPAALATNANIFTAAAVSNLMDWFTTPDFWDAFSKLFDNPLSAIMSLRYYPFDIVRHDPTHTTPVGTVRIVNVDNKNIGGYAFAQDYNTILDGGTIDYTAYYGNWADWACARYDLYVPYLGVVNISPSAVVNKHLAIFYNVDFLTGNAQITVKTYDGKYNKNGYDNGQLVYTTMAQMAVDIPIVYNNYNQQNIYKAVSAIKAVGAVGSGASQGASQGAMTGNPYAAIAGGIMGGLGAIGNSAINYATNFPRTEYGAKGDVGIGILAPQDAYLLITRKILAIPADGYGNISGNPSAYYGLIKSASGYIRATAAKCDGIAATNSELEKIAALLSAGIYV